MRQICVAREVTIIQGAVSPDLLGLAASGFLLGVGFAGLMAWLKPGMFASSTKDQR
jgi:hypothetical protein